MIPDEHPQSQSSSNTPIAPIKMSEYPVIENINLGLIFCHFLTEMCK